MPVEQVIEKLRSHAREVGVYALPFVAFRTGDWGVVWCFHIRQKDASRSPWIGERQTESAALFAGICAARLRVEA